MKDRDFSKKAIKFAKQNKNRIAKELTDPKIYTPEKTPISVFMAGSPGAGKTEFSKNLIDILEKDKERHVVRIDGDDVRSLIPGYTGDNSYLFQGAISIVVEKMHDLVLHNKQSFVLDGTFSKYEKAVENIERSIKKQRPIFIFYVYQKPEVAWRFTEVRETAEGRHIPKEAFITQFMGARETIEKVIDTFGENIAVFLVTKDFEKNTLENIYIVDKKSQIDQYIGEAYTEENLKECL